ncbi:Short-chain dehydrogenase/reductase SDR [Candidatus Rhodobacter oscarellae]|uniref:Short-chain dehydrogenase/reductase SDR n=1 Tax=Candidatus Rhodobacter oscarellae TaxID=1675527 RepID=A0A0J9E725_9RHOB|nr:SDR family NAD(P)-dependent oxidoreductase [Candidatus Rhodobacter lobularis]KMW58486.1 Short-chain dehydrogenase/reductase SDR [Candidatus Rhodobacter lobularis]
MELKGNGALITGGGSGLGAATARHFAEMGARVAVLDLDQEAAQRVAGEIGGIAVGVDVSDAAAVETAIAEAEAALGQAPRVAVNCAGIGLAARIVGRDGTPSFDLFERTLRINLFGSYYVMTHAARRMMTLEPDAGGERGVIINTASIAWQDGQLGQSAYAASKGAIASMSLPAAREFARAGIRVVAIAPGLFNTPMMEGLPEEVSAKIAADVPFPPRLGAPEEYALMASQIVANRYLNGTTLRLDGAVRLPPK